MITKLQTEIVPQSLRRKGFFILRLIVKSLAKKHNLPCLLFAILFREPSFLHVRILKGCYYLELFLNGGSSNQQYDNLISRNFFLSITFCFYWLLRYQISLYITLAMLPPLEDKLPGINYYVRGVDFPRLPVALILN